MINVAEVPGSAIKAFTEKLKQETESGHKLLELSDSSVLLMKSPLQLKDYAGYLALMLPVVDYIEQFVFPVTDAIILDLSIRKKANLIRQDLTLLGFENMDFETNYGFNPFPRLTSEAALAAMYVMEGSTLGGKLISGHVWKNLSLDFTNGAAYFNCYESPGLMWKQFIIPFASYSIKNSCEEIIIEFAKTYFAQLHKHFETAGKWR